MKTINFLKPEVLTNLGFKLSGKLYEVNEEDTFNVFTQDDVGTRIAVAKYADPSIVQILDNDGNIINETVPDNEGVTYTEE